MATGTKWAVSVALAVRRAGNADGWKPKLRALARKEYNRQVRETAEVIAEGGTIQEANLAPIWERRLMEAKLPVVLSATVAGYKLAEVEFGKRGADVEIKAKQGFEGLEEAFGADVYLAARLKPRVDVWVQETSRIESATSAKVLGRIQRRAAEEGLDLREISKAILAEGARRTPARAELLARTNTIWSFNQGAKELYRSEGAGGLEWLVTQDDALCEFCEEFDGIQIGMDDSFVAADTTLTGEKEVEGFHELTGNSLSIPFDIEHPPLHPHCRCAIVPLI